MALFLDCICVDVYNRDHVNYIDDTLGIVTMWSLKSFSTGLNGEAFLFIMDKALYLREV